ncbi:MAG: ATP-binding protein [Beijerinckiaceae bacterium]
MAVATGYAGALMFGLLAVMAILAITIFLLLRDHFTLEKRALDAEAQAERLTQTLARRAEPESAAELTHARLRAEAANAAKSRFLATVSHEIRTPLNGVLGMAALMKESTLTPEQASYVNAIHASGETLLELIDDILDFSKIESGRFDLKDEPFDFTALVEGVVELLAPRAQAKALDISAFIASPVRRLKWRGDAARLRQVLLNLAGNAIKFTMKGGVGISATLNETGAIVLAVTDTGPGIPAAKRDVIFAEFEQVDGSGSHPGEGTGLGLAIARRIVTRAGGTLTVDSRDGEGASFTAVLPLQAVDDAAAPRTFPLAGQRVLIVSQTPFSAPHLAQALAEAQAVAERAHTIHDAYRLLKPFHPDVVLIDMAFGEDARAFARQAKACGAHESIVLMSSYERRYAESDGLSHFDGWLMKPVRAASLISRLADEMTMRPLSIAPSHAMREPDFDAPQILLAEDNEINALLAIKQIERLNLRVVWAKDGNEALRLFEDASDGKTPPFAGGLFDLRMPGRNGDDLVRLVRALEQARGLPRTPIAAVTASAFPEDREACLASGFDDFLIKPMAPDALARMIGNWLRRAPAIEPDQEFLRAG